MRTAITMALLLTVFARPGRAVSASSAGREDAGTVSLFWTGSPRVGPADERALANLAFALLQSSNFNSTAHRSVFPREKEPERQARYRDAVRGKFLLVTFAKPHGVKTIGGEIEVLQIVVGLNRHDYGSSLHTIDGDGRVVEHGKYSGLLAIDTLKGVRKAVGEGAK